MHEIQVNEKDIIKPWQQLENMKKNKGELYQKIIWLHSIGKNLQNNTPRIGQGEWSLSSLQGMVPLGKISLSCHLLLFNGEANFTHSSQR